MANPAGPERHQPQPANNNAPAPADNADNTVDNISSAEMAASVKAFTLPQDIPTLSRLRDQLSDYLETLEHNTESIFRWLAENEDKIIMSHQQLQRDIVHHGDEQKARATLQKMGEIAGFVLELQDFKTLAEKTFGEDSLLAADIAAIPAGFPARILDTLPEIEMPEPTQQEKLTGILNLHAIRPELETDKEEEKKSKSFFSSWFRSAEEKEREEQEKREKAMRNHWRQVRAELVGLQSDRHYYVDSLMDWIGETLAPQTAQPDGAQSLMYQYQNPQFVIDRAQQDYAEVNSIKAQGLRDKALAYGELAVLLDSQNIPAFQDKLDTLWPRRDTAESKKLRELLLQDYAVDSLADLALTIAKDRGHQADLLIEAAQREKPLAFTDTAQAKDVFAKILQEVLDDAAPLDPKVLPPVLKNLFKGDGKKAFDTDSLPFAPVLARFKDDLPHASAILGNIFPDVREDIKTVVAMTGAVRDNDAQGFLHVLQDVTRKGNAAQFIALATLCHPGFSMLDTITGLFNNGPTKTLTPTLSQMMDAAIDAGVLGEMRLGTNAADADPAKVIGFFKNNVLSDSFSTETARRLLALSFANGGLDELRLHLNGRKDNWLEGFAESDLHPKQRMEWLAVLLEPFASDVVKSNILHEAAQAAAPTPRKTLADIEKTFTGPSVRLSDDRLLTNLQAVANIWYNADSKTLRFTLNGSGHTLMEDISPVMARETLALLQRKGGFDTEYDGLYRPEKVDRITTTASGTKVSWYRHTGDLNVLQSEAQKLHRRNDFVHEDSTPLLKDNLFSINQRSVALLQKQDDGRHLLIDKYGTVSLLEGKVDIGNIKPPLLAGGNGVWVNPENISILSLNPKGNTVELRVESKEFDDFLGDARPGEYLHEVKTTPAAFASIQQATAACATIISPANGSLQNMHFNLGALGYMMKEDTADGSEAGFHCRKYGPSKKPGFIATESDLADAIFKEISANENVISAGNVLTHKSCIDDAYYNADKGRLYLVIGQDILQVECDSTTAYKALKDLSAQPGFAVVGTATEKTSNTTLREVPADVINLQHATLLFYNRAQEKTFITTEGDRFHIGLDRDQSDALFRQLEDHALKPARSATASNQWVQGLRSTLWRMKDVTVPFRPALTDKSAKHLLQHALGEDPAETRAMPEPQKDFSIAAAKPDSSRASMTYPPRRAKPTTGAGKPGYRPFF